MCFGGLPTFTDDVAKSVLMCFLREVFEVLTLLMTWLRLYRCVFYVRVFGLHTLLMTWVRHFQAARSMGGAEIN